jgi:hypothetical protein
MHSQTRVTYNFLYLMLLLPIVSYIAVVFFHIQEPLLSFRIFAIFYGVIFIYKHQANLKVPIAAYFILAFCIYQYIWEYFNGALIGKYGNIQFLLTNTHFASFFLLIIIYNTSFKDSFIKNTISILKITIVLAVIVSIIQFFYIDFWNSAGYLTAYKDFQIERDIYLNRRSSIFGFIDLNSAGLDFIPLLSLFIGYSLVSRSKRYGIFIFFGGMIAILTNARYAMIGFIIITLQFLFINKFKFRIILKYSIFSILTIFLFTQLLLVFGFSLNDWISNRLVAEGSIYDSERFNAIITFISFFPKAIFLGLGGLTSELERASILDKSSYVHVGYLRFLLFYGIVGCFFLFGSWFLILKKFYKTAKSSNFWGSFFAFIVFLFSFATFYESSIFFYGLIFAFVFDKYYSDKVIRKKIMESTIPQRVYA